MARLNIDRQKRIEPERMSYAFHSLARLGIMAWSKSNIEINFIYKNSLIKFYPYSGWHTGKTVKDGRGLNKLLEQLI